MSVPLYDTLGTEAIGYIIDKGKPQQQQHECAHFTVYMSVSDLSALYVAPAASISTIVCDVVDKVNLVLDCVKDTEHTVKNIVLMETPSEDLVNRGQQAGIHILSLQEMEVSRLSFLFHLVFYYINKISDHFPLFLTFHFFVTLFHLLSFSYCTDYRQGQPSTTCGE